MRCPLPQVAGPPRRGFGRADVFALIALAAMMTGLALPGCQKVRTEAERSTATNNLKMIGLAAQNLHDFANRFPGNGSGVGPGVPSPETAANGSFFYHILSELDNGELFRNPELETPVWVKCYVEPARGGRRVAVMPACDYAVNVCALYGVGVRPTAENTTKTLGLQAITDGSSTTILAGVKALHQSDYATVDPAIDDTFLNLSAGGASRITARYTVGATTDLAALTGPPGEDFVAPTGERDLNCPAGAASDRFGNPYPSGVLFVFCDGHVAAQSYGWLSARPTVTAPGTKWGREPGVPTDVNPFAAALSPTGGEVFQIE